MYSLINFCFICFHDEEHLQPLSNSDSDNITYFIKLTSCVPEMCFNDINDQWLICNKCCEIMNAAYKFRQRCLISKTMLTDYFLHLHKVGNISSTANIYLTDINKFGYIKKEYQEENNIKINAVFIKMNENASEEENFDINPITEIKRENNPISLKLIDTGIENEDLEEHFHEKFDNISKTCDRANDDIKVEEIKIEENCDYPLYSDKCANDPLANLDEIKIDIVNNDIESMNAEINSEYKSEDNELLMQNHVISLENDDMTHIDASSCLTAMKETATNSSSKHQDKDNQKSCPKSIKKIKSYMLIHPESKQFECNICAKIFSASKTLNQHMRIHTGEKPYECDICHKKFTISSALKKHMRIHTGEKLYECSVCLKKFTCPSAVKTHMIIHSGEKPHQCSVCLKKFTQSFHLSRHIKIHTGENLHECSVCKKNFTCQSALKNHIIIHTGEKPHQCSVCLKKFNQSFHLSRHIKMHTGEKSHECGVCQKKFTESAGLREHMRIHTGEKPHECEVCNKKFTHSSALRKHIRIHTGEKTHECSVCQKKFTCLSTLKKHIIIHTGEKPYECSVCQKKFAYLSALKDHMRIHTGEKPHECSVCKMKFIQASSLTVHMRRHTGLKPHECSECQKKFICTSALRVHAKTHKKNNTLI